MVGTGTHQVWMICYKLEGSPVEYTPDQFSFGRSLIALGLVSFEASQVFKVCEV